MSAWMFVFTGIAVPDGGVDVVPNDAEPAAGWFIDISMKVCAGAQLVQYVSGVCMVVFCIHGHLHAQDVGVHVPLRVQSSRVKSEVTQSNAACLVHAPPSPLQN